MMSHRIVLSLISVAIAAASLRADDQATDFSRDVSPILKKHCVECHGADAQESHLRLDSMLAALRGGDSGEHVIVPGDSARSHLMERVTSSIAQMRMPPDSAPLSGPEVAVLKRWIDQGSSWSEVKAELAKEVRSDHWSLQSVVRPTVPLNESRKNSAVAGEEPIDAFVDAKLREAGLSFSAPAEPQRLIRRLFLVMHGLPPTPEQVSDFVAAYRGSEVERRQVWEQLIDSVLSNPRYGERWATHWLDVVRFGETNGFETNRERPSAYRYRDWVIDSFNNDKPYDQFVKQQIAGDSLDEPIGTGFLVAGPNDIVKGQDALLGLMQRQDELTDMVNATGTAFMGLTTGCARCHNHKFDPITQSDFYAMQAIFAGVEHGERELPPSAEVTARVSEIDAEAKALRVELARYQREPSGMREPVNAHENTERFPPSEAKHIRFTIRSTSASEPCIDELQVFAGDRNVALASLGTRARSSGDFVHPLHKLEHINDGKFGNAHSWIASQRSGGWVALELPELVAIDRIVWGRDREGKFADRLATDYAIEISVDGEQWRPVASSKDRKSTKSNKQSKDLYSFARLGAQEQQSAQRSLDRLLLLEQQRTDLHQSQKAYTGNFRQPPTTRRLHRGDPTAPREEVAPGAIGALGELSLPSDATEQERRLALANWIARPDHPLTARVMVNRLWQFHFGTGLVDTPSDFGANGAPPTHPELLDWLASEFMSSGWSIKHLQRIILTSRTWQQDSRPRADALGIDAASRLLWRFPPRRLEAEAIRDSMLAVTGVLDPKMGGPGFSGFEIDLENVRHYFPKKDYGPQDWRRMIYMNKVRQEKESNFGIFDCPDASQVTPKRSRSTTPLQALNLMNGRFVLQQALLLSERLARETEEIKASDKRIERAYQLCFSRPADSAEVAEAGRFIRTHGWQQFARALLNSNEFVFIP